MRLGTAAPVQSGISRAGLWLFGASVAVLAALPWTGLLTSAWYPILITAIFFALFAMSWDLLSGSAGQVNLGHPLFIGAGAYSSGLISVTLGWNPIVTIVIGALVALLVGTLVGLPALRLHGPYFALVTLVALIAATRLVLIYSDVTGGASGLSFVPKNLVPSLGYAVPLAQLRFTTYYYALGYLLVLGGLLLFVARSRWGALFEAIRENESAVQAAGINTAKFKMAAFMVSAGAAGAAGAAYAHLPTLAAVQPGGLNGVLNLDLSILIIAASIIGGLGTTVGPLIGAFIVVVGEHLLSQLPHMIGPLSGLSYQGQGWITLIFLIVLVLLIRFAPRGLIPTLLRPWRPS